MDELKVVSPQPPMKGFFALPLRPLKRSLSPSSDLSPHVGNPPPKRVRTTSVQDSDIQTISSNQEDLVYTILPYHDSRTDPSQLHYPAMLLKKAKRQGLPIHEQFIHPGFFARALDQKTPWCQFYYSRLPWGVALCCWAGEEEFGFESCAAKGCKEEDRQGGDVAGS